jgi:hypothetical protein
MGGEAAVHDRLPGAAGLPRTRRLAPERRGRPDPATASGRHPRRRDRRGDQNPQRRAARGAALLPRQLPAVE